MGTSLLGALGDGGFLPGAGWPSVGGMHWDPEQYVRFADHRERPFHELVARVGAQDPASVIDLGCGPGTATATLAARWPGAEVLGLDASQEMIGDAQRLATPRLRFAVADARAVDVSGADLVVSNAMLQWLPDHRELLARWRGELKPGAWLAFQVPGNFDAPSHALMREVAARPRWAPALAGVLRGGDSVDTPLRYAEGFLAAGWRVDAWETTYVQWLPGADPVLEWVRGTGLRPVLDVLDPDDAAAFEAEYGAELRRAYPASVGADGTALTALPFRRIFVVARRPPA
jgi:trans-aconitate 2-methyltransferase